MSCSDDCLWIVATTVDHDIGAELACGVQPGIGQVDRDYVTGAEQPGREYRGEADRSRADNGDNIGRSHRAVEHPHLVRGGQDIGEHDHLFVGDPVGHLVGGVVRERDPHIVGLGAVDEVAEDPPTAAQALPVTALLGNSGSCRRR